jgi:hypothetical protein
VDEDAGVGCGVFGDGGNLDVSETVGPEVEGFALGGWQMFNQRSQQAVEVGLFG